jgi:NADPH:quinone reductase-like Zn-dependent oxidoreductase/SAM-dependent methyltransferase/acyl carrier protein
VGSTQTDLTSTKWETYASGILAVHQDQKPVDIDLKSYQVLCPDPLDIASYYQQCDQHGIEYGDDFQTLQQLWRGENQAIALVQVSRSLQHEITQYAIHPTLLDGCFQAIGALLPASSHQTYLPVGCQQFTVYQSAKDTLWSLVQWRDRDQLTVDLQLVNEAGERIADVIALQLKAVTLPTRSQISDASPPDWQNWLYRVEWQIPSPASILPTPVELSEQLSPHFSHLLAQPAFQTYADYLPELEALSLVYIQQAIAQLGCDFAAIEIFGITELLQQLAIVPQQQALFRRMLEILAEAQILEVREDLGRVIQPWTAADDREESLIADSAVTSAIEYTLLHRTGSHLAEILQGKRDPLQLLFPDGDISLLTQLYQESPGARVMNTLIQQAIAQIQSQFSTERSLRILEVGAGTGGTTAQILPHLQPDRTEYVFTDLSPLFLSKAQQKFVDYPFMRYQRLDLERSPQTQGFSPSQFQVILAANVLHATQDLHQTLSHLRSLLAPGGCLILLEGTKPLRWVDLIFGLTEGWWRFQDYQLRPNHPLISVQQWQTLLSEVGFESAIALQPDAYPNQETAFQSILIANTPTAPKLDQVACQNWLILDKESEPESLGIALKNQLETLNHTVQYFSDIPTIDLVSILLSTQFDHILDLRGLSTIDESLRRSKPFQQTDLVSLDLQVQTSCSILLELIQAITSTVLENFPQLTIVTQGAIADDSTTLSGLAQSSLLGLAKVIRLEHPELNARCLDLDPTQPQLSQVEVLLACLLLDRSENEMAWRQNTWQVPRLIRDELSPENSTSTNDRLIIETPGNLDSLQFAPSQRRSPKPHEVEIQVHATGLNFRDVLNALGVYPGEAGELGCECAGTIAQVGEAVTHFTVGQAAIALAAGSFGQYITVDAALVVATPANLSLEAAATIPAAFLTAHHALQQLATIKPGDRVLIHAAAGGVGQAAIQIAQQAGAEIFATASPEKQELVRSLGVTHVFNSRAVEFSEQILSITNGAGVNIILNSLSGDFIAKSCAILQPNGCFLELGKLNIWSAEEFAKVLPQAQYHLIDLVELCQQQPDLVQSQLQAIAAQFESHQLRPLPTKTFSRSQIIPAFRWMQQGKHTGKLVITQTRFDTTLEIYRDRTYLITGGLGGLGLLMAEWLIRQGATRLVLVGRNPHRSPEQVQQLQSTGAAVQVVAADVCDRAAVAQILTDIAASDYPLAGVIHAAGGLADATLRQLSPDQLAEVLQPKVTGAWNLHQLTAHLPLDFFVLFSSATALFGSPGQANHVAANTFLDALAHYRQSQGLPALSINWGTWSQVGAAAARQADTRLEQLGISAIAPPIGQEIFASLLHRSLTQIGVIPIDWTQFFQQNRSTPFLEYFQQDSTNSVEQARSPSPQSPSLILQTLATASDRAVALKEYVRSQIAQILGFQPQEIDPQTGFFDLGMDSLTSVELKSRLQTDLNCTLPTTIAFDYPTLDALIPHLLSQIDLNNEFTPNKTIVQPDNLSLIPSSELSDLTEAEIATLLAQELEIH